MTAEHNTAFEIVTWYDTWNQRGLDNLVSKKIPLNYAGRYNLAFAKLVTNGAGYTVEMAGQFADAVKLQIQQQAPDVAIYAGLGDTGIAETVNDNKQHQDRSTQNIISWLQQNGYSGISIDAEGEGMPYVAEFVTQLGPGFRQAGLGIAVSAPWPESGPASLYGDTAIQAFNEHVDTVELQDYSSMGTQYDAQVWIDAGVKADILMGGVCTENGRVQTSLEDTRAWTQYAIKHGLKGMFSWRLDNDHCTHGTDEDADPTCIGAKTIYDTVMGMGE